MGGFKPWRRKIGVLTLVMACVFAAGWVRSLSVLNFLHRSAGLVSYMEFESSNGNLVWWSTSKHEFANPPRLTWSIGDLQYRFQFIEDRHVRWSLKIWGFRIGEAYRRKVWVIPYWSIVIPLTLISAYLLLSKPRVAKPKAITKSIPETVA